MSSVFSSLFSRDPLRDFPYETVQKGGQKPDYETFLVNKGKRKGSDEEVTIFSVDLKISSAAEVALAKQCAKRLKTLRHPNLLTFIDSLETDSAVQIVTESVTPLSAYLENLSDLKGERRTFLISWGLYQVANAVKFLSQDAKLLHNNIRLGTVYVNKCGEWKLFGFEYLTPHQNASSIPFKPYGLEKYNAPECKSGNVSSSDPWSVDSWGLGCLIWELFNGLLTTGGVAQLKAPKAIPKQLHQPYSKLLAPNPAQRATMEQFIELCRKPNGFMQNKVVDTVIFLEEFHLKEARDKSTFLSQFQEHLSLFPEDVQKYKILPLLVNAYEYGNAGSSILSPLLKIGKLLNENEYQQQIVPCVVKFFNSPDRSTRVKLLQQVENFVEHLQPPVVNDKIFTPLCTGFMDTNPAVRESTVKAVVFLAPKLNYNNMNIELMKHLARLQSRDDQAGIRTNTTICLGKIAAYIHPQNRQKILTSAFGRAIKDPFPPSRVAGVLAFSATQQFYPLSEVANRILPVLSTSAVDPEKQVRDQAFKAIRGFLEKLEKASENPDLIQEMESQVNAASASVGGVGESVPQWATWALSALSSKFYKTAPAAPTGGTTAAAAAPAASSGVTQAVDTMQPGQRAAPSAAGGRLLITTAAMKIEEEQKEEENAWDEDESDWGQMEDAVIMESQKSNQGAAITSHIASPAQGWDEDDTWEGIEESHDSQRQSGSRKSSTLSQPAISNRLTPQQQLISAGGVNAGGWSDDQAENGSNDGDGWGNDGAFNNKETVKTTNNNVTLLDERKQRVEQRRLELEKKRQARQAEAEAEASESDEVGCEEIRRRAAFLTY